MVQYKKDEIKERIDGGALAVFSHKGYRETKISDIGKKAGVSVGNIYRYYKSKDEIFYSVVPESFLSTVEDLLAQKISAMDKEDLQQIQQSPELWMFHDEFIGFMVQNRERMLIIFHHNKGTKYENAKNGLVAFLMNRMKAVHTVRYDGFIAENKDDFIIKIIYESMINITLSLLKEDKSLEELKRHLTSMNVYHMFGITGLLK